MIIRPVGRPQSNSPSSSSQLEFPLRLDRAAATTPTAIERRALEDLSIKTRLVVVVVVVEEEERTISINSLLAPAAPLIRSTAPLLSAIRTGSGMPLDGSLAAPVWRVRVEEEEEEYWSGRR